MLFWETGNCTIFSYGEGFFAIGGGKRIERGGKWGMRGREVGIEGAGNGDRGDGKRGSSTPLSTPTLIACYLTFFSYSLISDLTAPE